MNFQDSNHGLTADELLQLEDQLKLLQPNSSRLDRERVIFFAGQASAVPFAERRRRWAWPCSFAAMSAVAASLLVMLVMQDSGRPLSEHSTSQWDWDGVAWEKPVDSERAPQVLTASYHVRHIDRLLSPNAFLVTADTSSGSSHDEVSLPSHGALSPFSVHEMLDDI